MATKSRMTIKLFCFLPIFSYRISDSRSEYWLFGIRILKISHKIPGKRKYYVLGVPVMKIKTKAI